MNNVIQSRLASVLMIALAAWLLISQAFISISGAALTDLIIVSLVIGFVGFVQLFWENNIPSWINALAAIWLFVAAFAFAASTAAVWNLAVTACVAFILAAWDGFEVDTIQHQHHMHA